MAVYNEADFVMQGREVQDPEIAKDELELYYDVKGKHNSHLHRDTLLDMSGQGKDGELSGFDYDGKLSGYDGDNGLVFDGIDDKLERVALDGLSEDAFTYQLNNNVISYGGGGTVKWVKDGKVMERKGINLVRNQESQWLGRNSSVVFNSGRIVSEGDGSLAFPQVWQSFEFTEGSKYLSIVEARVLNSECSELRLSNGNYNIDTIKAVGHPTKNVWYELMGIQTVSNSARGVAVYHRYSDEKTSVGKKMEIRNAQFVDLTATFGAGNEPSLEEIQADPDKWQWLPNPMDLLEATDLKGNILGDMEDIVDVSPRDRQSGKEVFTEHADNSHVHVEVDGQSYQENDEPTPDNPSEIHSLNDFDVVSSVEKLSEEQLQEYDYGIEYENVDKINLSLSEPLRSAGDVYDRLFKDSDGLWKVERNVREFIADGVNLTPRKNFGSDNSNWLYYLLMRDLPGAYDASKTSFSFSHLGRGGNTSSGTTQQSHIGYATTAAPNVVYINMGNLSTRGYSNSNEGIKSFFADEYNKGTPFTIHYDTNNPTVETLDQELQHQLNTLKSFKGSNYIYTVQNTDNPHKEQLTPTLHATFNSKDYLKETRTLTNLLIWARELSDEELIHHNKLFLNRFNLQSDTVSGEPIEQTLNLLHGGMIGHSLEQNYTINI